jgi:hypothetical protein
MPEMAYQNKGGADIIVYFDFLECRWATDCNRFGQGYGDLINPIHVKSQSNLCL